MSLLYIFVVLVLTLFSAIVFENFAFAQSNPSNNFHYYNLPFPPQLAKGDVLSFYSNTEGKKQLIEIPIKELLFNVLVKYDQGGKPLSYNVLLNPQRGLLYQEIEKNNPSDSVFIYPLFTKAAYSKNGFYDFYNNICDPRCLTVSIPSLIGGGYSSSTTGARVLELLNYSYLTDVDVDKNPDILKHYKRVIVLHNEYVTKKEFYAIRGHPNVIFLYPNALYAEVKTDYIDNTITLVRGHGYPDLNTKNGFDWNADNSKFEYNTECDNWNFYVRENKTFLNCYPEYRILYDYELLRYLQKDDPTDLQMDIGNWLRYPQNPHVTKALIDDYDINATSIPQWMVNPATWYLSGEISREEFGNILIYLHDNKIIR